MTDDELAEFRDRLKFQHIAKAEEGQVQAYTQEPPYTARKEFLTQMRSEIYEDFGALDVHAIAAGATNDHIDAAYQPLDDNADDFEYFVGDAIEKILELAGIDDEPQFKRNRISNEKERTDMILEASNYLDEETILKKLPFVAPEEVPDILAKLDEESYSRYTEPPEPDAPEDNPEGDE
jgi:aspartate carbamoyltransferase regulatory subunit